MSDPVRLSIIAPAYDEEDNIEPLVLEVGRALAGFPGGMELVMVDDGSRDGTAERVRSLMEERPWLRLVQMRRNCGQSGAFHAGIRASRGELIAMLDSDLQNDPADLPKMVRALDEQRVDWVQGARRRRNDGNRSTRRFASWVGRTFRRRMLGDTIRDTGCSARVFRREIGLQLPLQFRGVHRFMPVYARKLGFKVVEFDVNHRARHAGVAKYGTFDRAVQGLRDLFAVRWMFNRLRDTSFTEAAPPMSDAEPHAAVRAHGREKTHA